MSEKEKVSAAKFMGGGGGRIALYIAYGGFITFLIYTKSFTSDYHFAGVVLSFLLLSGSVAIQSTMHWPKWQPLSYHTFK